MTVSTDLSEIAQNGISQIIEEHKAGQASTSRHFYISVGVVIVAMILTVVTNVYLQQRTEQRINQPQPAVVKLSLTNTEQNVILCPGDTLHYQLAIEIDKPSVVDSDAVVRNLDTRRTEILSDTVRNIYEEPGTVVIATNWRLPELLPATRTQSERRWTAGRHRRLIAVTGAEGDNQSSVVAVDFIISATCPNVRL